MAKLLVATTTRLILRRTRATQLKTLHTSITSKPQSRKNRHYSPYLIKPIDITWDKWDGKTWDSMSWVWGTRRRKESLDEDIRKLEEAKYLFDSGPIDKQQIRQYEIAILRGQLASSQYSDRFSRIADDFSIILRLLNTSRFSQLRYLVGRADINDRFDLMVAIKRFRAFSDCTYMQDINPIFYRERLAYEKANS
ncbi:hypothetical protein BU16DRAFT_568490 [Lophium mytilinum]|uniref:Uncharacterized protein n=1 Tax=Lophium mytilinum TaxID=390894 RepID=A0A6A6QA71_9PEZI|nr:hypothetical protein BU16DRAFT_568490 [Lophium mytilinum]